MAALTSSRRWRGPALAAACGALLALGLAACGKPLVTEAYRGVPIWTYEGDLQRSSSVPRGSLYRAALFFQPRIDTVDPEQMRELVTSGIEVEAPSSFVLNVYEPPPKEDWLKGADGADLGYAVARVLIYDDRDGDNRREAGEAFAGILPPAAVVYLPRDFAAGEATSRGALTAGFYLVPLPQPCDYMPPPATNPGDCGVPLGASCDDDSGCNGGFCLKESKEPWPAGYCVVPEPPRNGCRPGASAYLHSPKYVPLPGSLVGFYARACTSDSDCGRVHPVAQIYRCDPTTLACMPPLGGPIAIGGPLEVEPLCAGGARATPGP